MVYCYPAKSMLKEAVKDSAVSGAGDAVDSVGEVLRLQNVAHAAGPGVPSFGATCPTWRAIMSCDICWIAALT